MAQVGKGPGLLLVEGRFSPIPAMETFCAEFTPDYELEGPSRAWLDLRRTAWVNGSPRDCAPLIREILAHRSGTEVAGCLAATRLGARVGVTVVRPGGFLVLDGTNERPFVRRQGINRLPGIEPRLDVRLHGLGLGTIGAFADLTSNEVISLVGASGLGPWNRARGWEAELGPAPCPASPQIDARSDLDPPTNHPRLLEAALARLCATAGHELRTLEMAANRIVLELGFLDGFRGRGEVSFTRGLQFDADLVGASLELLGRVLTRRPRVSFLLLSLQDLARATGQGDFFPSLMSVKRKRLQPSLDALRRKYGSGTVLAGPAFHRQREIP